MKHGYSVNNNNQLLVKSPITKKSITACGDFHINKNNRLEYWLKEPPAWRKIYNLPRKIVFRGRWKINKNYDLELVFEETKSQFKNDSLVIKGDIISTDSDTLAFEIKTYDQNGFLHLQILQLSVTWRVNENNRLGFIVKNRQPDIIIFEGNWQINDNQQIAYAYEKTELKTKTKVTKVLAFEGFWQINGENKLTYILKRCTDSKFDFRAQIESRNIRCKEGLIKYRLGAGLRKTTRKGGRIISLYGIWKFSRKLGLGFQVDYGKLKMPNITFDADISFKGRNKIVFALKNIKGEPLGLNVTFTHKFLKALDAEAFLSLKKSCQEKTATVGIRIPF